MLQSASSALSATLDLDRTLGAAVGAFVPALADICIIYSLEAGSRLRARATAAADPAIGLLTNRLRGAERPLDESIETELVDGRRPLLHGLIEADGLQRRITNEAEAELAGRLGPVWRTALPLRAHDGVWGIVVLFSGNSRGELTQGELKLVETLAAQAAQALENACLYELAAGAQARFASAFDSAPIGMALVRADSEQLGIVSEVNPAMCEIVGMPRQAIVASQLTELYHPDDRAAASESANWLLSGEVDQYAGERRFLRPDGHTVWVQVRAARLAGDPDPHVVLQVQDVTDRKRYEGQLQYLADHDPLTGLFNRRRFTEELEWVVAYSRRYGSPAAVVLIDVDNFKFVNDTYGHAIGDELLSALGETLRTRCRETDIAGRLGGDEFGVILPQSGREEAETVAQSLLEAVREAVRAPGEGRTLRATVSIGVRLVPPDTALTAEELLSDADIALYDAKEGGRDRVSISSDGGEVTNRLRARISWSERIREALVRDQFELFEQPIFGILSGRVEITELLLRLRDPDGTIIAPGEFLDVAERFGQIQAIDCWVIARAVRLLAERQAAGIALELEVNLSGGSITDATVIDFIVSEVRNAPIDPTKLTFEVTETAAIVNIDRARVLAQSLADLGCRFALDDFGSGFGSFYYLKHLPFDIVKIDGEFVKDLVGSQADRLTVQAIVQIACGLGKTTIAERIEDEPTLQLLRTLGVDFAQGYHLGKPRPVVTDPGFGRNS